MTTTVATPLQRSPHRIRRNLLAVLAGGALIASTALVVNRIVDDDSETVPVQAPEAPSIEAATASPAVVNPAVASPVPNSTAADICVGGLGWACIFTELSSGVTAADVCAGGLGWACIFTPQS